MKVYISGSFSGDGIEKIKQQYEKIENYLIGLGYIVVNEKEEYLSACISEKDRYQYDMTLLAVSDVLFLVDNWRESQQAILEKAFAESAGKHIWYEGRLQEEEQQRETIATFIDYVSEAIEEVTGMKRIEYSKEGRSRRLFFARMLFSISCRRLSLKASRIAEAINRDHTTVRHYLNKYKMEYRFNIAFRKTADRIEEKLRSRLPAYYNSSLDM